MAYRKRLDFTNPTPDELVENRRKAAWIFPFSLLLPSLKLFDADADLTIRILYAILWVAVNITACWWLLGLPFRWMSEQENRKVNDEWNQAITGDACKWGLAAAMAVGIALMLASLWLPLHAGKVIYALLSAMVLTGLFRMSWLSRGEPLDDE